MKEQRMTYPYKPHAFKAISIEQLMGLTKPPRMERIHTCKSELGDIEVMSRGLTVVLSRDVRANVKIAADIAVAIARNTPDRPVWYVNTFAGIELMQDAMERARINNGMGKIATNRDIDGDYEHPHPTSAAASVEEYDNNTPPAADYLSRVNEIPLPQQREGLGEGDPGALPNLHIYEIPFGEWNAMELVKAMNGGVEEEVEPEWQQRRREILGLPNPREVEALKRPKPIVIINSFDYSPLSRGGKWKMARELMNLLEQFDMSLVLFTQEVRLEFAAGIAGRGSVGLMCGIAARVARLRDPFERLIRTRNPRIQAEKAIVHEAQMHAPDAKKKEDRLTIAIKTETGHVLEEITGSKLSLARHLGEVLLD